MKLFHWKISKSTLLLGFNIFCDRVVYLRDGMNVRRDTK
mgnify:CR=1 FL=1